MRVARPRDLDRVSALWSAISEHHAALDPVFTLRADAGEAIRSLLRAQLRDPAAEVLVWDEESSLSGLCIVRVDRIPPILQEVERAEITDLGVSPAARRRGIGAALVAAAFDWVTARGLARVEVRVAAANPEGQAFWRALGFEPLMDVMHRHL